MKTTLKVCDKCLCNTCNDIGCRDLECSTCDLEHSMKNCKGYISEEINEQRNPR